MMQQRSERGRWLPGVSGNPGGRPRDRLGVRRVAAEAAAEALAVLLVVMRDGGAPPGARRQAARDLLRLAVGRDVPLREASQLLALAGLTHLPEYRPPAAPLPDRPENRSLLPRRPVYLRPL